MKKIPSKGQEFRVDQGALYLLLFGLPLQGKPIDLPSDRKIRFRVKKVPPNVSLQVGQVVFYDPPGQTGTNNTFAGLQNEKGEPIAMFFSLAGTVLVCEDVGPEAPHSDGGF